MTDESLQLPLTQSPDIVARAGRYYRNARYLFCSICLGYGIWSCYHGFYAWPAENLAAQIAAQRIPHAGLAIPLNRILGIFLPTLAAAILAWTLYNSRGQIRLHGPTLSIPGHPPIPLDAITRIDKRRWEHKGIAVIEYQLPNATNPSRFRLDDFVYQRDPIDSILSRIEAHIAQSSG